MQGHLAEDVVHAGGHIFIVFVESFEVVHDGPQPGLHFLRLGAGEEANVLVQTLGATGGDDAFVQLAGNRHFDTGREGEDGFTGAGGTGQVYQVDIGVQQQVQGNGLVYIPRYQAPDFLVHQIVLVQIPNDNLVFAHIRHLANESLFINHELVDGQPGQVALTTKDVFGNTLPLDGFDLLDGVPERVREFFVPFRQQVNIVQQHVVVIVLGLHAEAPGFQSHVDVLADKDDVARCVAGLQGRQGIDDLVVVQVLGQAMVALVVRAHQYR